MNKCLLLLTLLMAQLTPLSASAEEEEEFLTAGELLTGCEEGSSPGAPNQYCMQYLFGFVQTVLSLQSADPSQPQLFCIDPQRIGLPEVTDTMTAYLRSQQGRMDQEAYKLVGEALAKNYPCDSKPF